MKIGDKEYTAYYYGQIGSDYFGDQYQSVDYWQLQDAYDDFKNNELGDSVLDENDAPFTMAAKRVYVLDFVFPDGTKERKYYRTDEKSFEKLGGSEGIRSRIKRKPLALPHLSVYYIIIEETDRSV